MFNGQWGQSSQINKLLYNEYNNGLYVFPYLFIFIFLFIYFVYEVHILHVTMPFKPALNVFGRFASGFFFFYVIVVN